LSQPRRRARAFAVALSFSLRPFEQCCWIPCSVLPAAAVAAAATLSFSTYVVVNFPSDSVRCRQGLYVFVDMPMRVDEIFFLNFYSAVLVYLHRTSCFDISKLKKSEWKYALIKNTGKFN
jgi:hypothetical protein